MNQSQYICPCCLCLLRPSELKIRTDNNKRYLYQCEKCSQTFYSWTCNTCSREQWATQDQYQNILQCKFCQCRTRFYFCTICKVDRYVDAQDLNQLTPILCQCQNQYFIVNCLICAKQIFKPLGTADLDFYCQGCKKGSLIQICQQCTRFQQSIKSESSPIQELVCSQGHRARKLFCDSCRKFIEYFTHFTVCACGQRHQLHHCPCGQAFKVDQSNKQSQNCPSCNRSYFLYNCECFFKTLVLKQTKPQSLFFQFTGSCAKCSKDINVSLCLKCGDRSTSTLRDNCRNKCSTNTEPDIKCKVCQTNYVSLVYIPCGHAAACTECDAKMQQQQTTKKCPICRAEGETKKLFFN